MKNNSLKDQAYKTLKEKLINCEYPPGTLLNESMLSEELAISRTPIRDALTRIEQEGFVKTLPKKGIFVTEISMNDVKQIFQARKELEPIALKLSAQYLPPKELIDFKESFEKEEEDVRTAFRTDMLMHLFIINHCGNRFIIDTLNKVFEENTRIIISSKQNEVKIHDARKEHIEILDLLLEKKYEDAEKSLRYHIEQCERAAVDFFYNQPIGTWNVCKTER